MISIQPLLRFIGSPLKDALNPTDDGYDHLRKVEHVGTVLQDGADNAVNPTPKVEE